MFHDTADTPTEETVILADQSLRVLSHIIDQLVTLPSPGRYALTADEAAWFKQVYGRTLLTSRCAIGLDAQGRLYRL